MSNSNIAAPEKVSKDAPKLVLKKKEVDLNFEKFPMDSLRTDFVKLMKPKEGLFDLDPKTVQKSFEKICELWNKDQKSRNFVKHLIAAFLPYNNFNRYLNIAETDDIRCAILGFKLTGIGNIAHEVAPFSTKKMIIDAHCFTEKREQYTDDEKATLNEILDKMPIEIRKNQIGVHSENSEKSLMVESISALLHFSQEMLLRGNDELNFTVKKSMIKRFDENSKKPLKKVQVNQVAKATTYGLSSFVNEKGLNTLKAFKEKLDTEKNQN